MIEHSFYQGLNLVQSICLHIICGLPNMQQWRMIVLITSLLPWIFRKYFPIHPFSDNYIKKDPKSTTIVRIMYRIKKYQYMFYKHALLHGLNTTVAFNGYCFQDTCIFRLYWLLLNAAYVFEFFLQTLVKKDHMSQITMLILQTLLMLACSIVAIAVLSKVSLTVSFISLLLNLMARKRGDFLNTLTLISLCFLFEKALI